MKWLVMLTVVIFIVATPSALALGDPDYQTARRRLLLQQQTTSARIKKLRQEAGLPTDEPLTEEKRKDIHLFQIQGDLSSTFLPLGKLLYGQTLNRLVVGSEPSQVLIVLDGNQGAFDQLRLVGEARQSSTPGRVSIDLTHLLLRTSKAITIDATALDNSGAQGLEGQVFSSKAFKIAGALASSFISGLAATQQTQVPTAFGFNQVEPGSRNAVLGGLTQAAADESKSLIGDATQEKPVLVIEAGTPVAVMIKQEVKF